MTDKAVPKEAPTPVDEDVTSRPGAFAVVAPKEPVVDSPAGSKFVEYKGRAATRRITVEQWGQAGVEHPEVTWDKSNGFKVPIDSLSEEAINVLRSDGSFSFPAEG